VIPVADAVYILVPCMVASLALGWAARAVVSGDRLEAAAARASDAADQVAGAARLYEVYEADREQRAAEAEHDAAWEAEFSEPDLGDFVTGVLEHDGAGCLGDMDKRTCAACIAADAQAAEELTHEWHDHAPLRYADEGVPGCPACEARWETTGGAGMRPASVIEGYPAPPEPEALEGDILAPRQERAPTIAELADHADYTITWTELDRLRVSAYAWYDEAFSTGAFRAIA
jgi:hypothetical protein